MTIVVWHGFQGPAPGTGIVTSDAWSTTRPIGSLVPWFSLLVLVYVIQGHQDGIC